jgi:hypothetical protein
MDSSERASRSTIPHFRTLSVMGCVIAALRAGYEDKDNLMLCSGFLILLKPLLGGFGRPSGLNLPLIRQICRAVPGQHAVPGTDVKNGFLTAGWRR